MIEFLRPGALGALPVAGLPLALHWWGRIRGKPTAFSAVALLREAARDLWTPNRLKRWALLAARTALMSALILFLARPGFRGALGAGPVRGVVLLDASYSLRVWQSGETGFDRAKKLARGVFQNRRPGDQWGLVVFSDRVESSVSPQADPAALGRALEAATPTHRGTRFSVAFAEAAKLLRGNGTVVLFSDAAAHGAGEGRSPWDIPPSSLVVVEVAAPRPNAGFVGGWPGGREAPPRVDLRAWGNVPPRTWTLRQDGRVEARGQVLWDGARGTVHPSARPGAAEISLDPDALTEDDRWFLVTDPLPPFSVLCVNGAPGLSPVGDETFFIRPVLDGLLSEGMTVDWASPGDLFTKDLSPFQVVALLNPPPFTTSTVERLKSFVDSGGGLWMTAGDRGGFLSLRDLLPLEGLASQEMDEGLGGASDAPLPNLNGFLWSQVRLERVLGGAPRLGARVILSSERTKTPVLTVGTRGQGRVALWGSSIDRDWTNFPAKPSFPVLVGDLLRWLSGSRGPQERTSYTVGETVERGGGAGQPTEVLRPDGRLDRATRVGALWAYDRTDVPGLYEWRGARTQTVAVNVPSEREGDLSRLTPEQWRAWLGPVPFRWVPAERARPMEIQQALQGRDLTPAMAKAILCLLILETGLLWTRRRTIA